MEKHNFKKILVPLDGSETAEQVIPYAVSEARAHGASVLLLRAIAPLRRSLSASPAILRQIFDQLDSIAAEYLGRITETIQSEGIVAESIIERGFPAQTIIDVAQEKECDLIILGSHGETNAPQWRFGSVANKVLKAMSDISILLVITKE